MTPLDAGDLCYSGFPDRPPRSEWIDDATYLRWQSSLTDVALVILTAAALYAVAIGAVLPKEGYIGLRDIVSAIAWGLGASAVAGPLADTLSRARESLARLRSSTS